jgi:hypothetical protein
MSEEPLKKHEKGRGLTEAGKKKLKGLLEQLPKDQRIPLLDEALARKQNAARMTGAEEEMFTQLIDAEKLWLTRMTQSEREAFLKEIKAGCRAFQQMTETEKKAYLREREYRQMSEEIPEWERESLIKEIEAERDEYAKMSEAEKETYWKEDESFQELMSKAVPVVIKGIQKHCPTKPQDAKQLTPEEAKKKIHEFFDFIGAFRGDTVEAAFYFLSWIWEELKETIEPTRSYVKIDRYLRILLGDSYLSDLPVTLQGYMKARGIEKRIQEMHLEEILESLFLPEKESWLDTVLPTLDMLFEERYGWPEGTAKTKTILELCLALEHAVEHDDPQKPSVWEIT